MIKKKPFNNFNKNCPTFFYQMRILWFLEAKIPPFGFGTCEWVESGGSSVRTTPFLAWLSPDIQAYSSLETGRGSSAT